jgi:hypothetical protein
MKHRVNERSDMGFSLELAPDGGRAHDGYQSLTRNWWFSCASEAAGDKLDAGNHEPGESAFK